MDRPSRKIELALHGNEEYLCEMSESVSFYVYSRARLILKTTGKEKRLSLLQSSPSGVRGRIKSKVEELWQNKGR